MRLQEVYTSIEGAVRILAVACKTMVNWQRGPKVLAGLQDVLTGIRLVPSYLQTCILAKRPNEPRRDVN